MNKTKINIWKRDFELNVDFDCFSNEEILSIQKEALELFIENYQVIDNSLEKVKEYCIAEDNSLNEIDNIFKYVIPNTIYVVRDDVNRVVALLCDYKFDIEHGIAIVFENEKFKKIVTQDEVL